MGFCVIMQEVEQLQESILNQTALWISELDEAGKAVGEYISCLQEGASGELAEAICAYLTEVHQYLLNKLYMAQVELYTRMIQYGEGLFTIESNANGYISEQSLQDEADHLAQERWKFSNVADEAERSMQTVSDLISGMPASVEVERGYQDQVDLRIKLMDRIVEYERDHAKDLDMLEEMQECITSLLNKFRGSGSINPCNYESCEILKNEEVMMLEALETAHSGYLIGAEGEIQACEEQRRVRILAEARIKEGRNKVLMGLTIVGGSVVSIVTLCATGPAGTPAVASLWGKILVGTNAVAICYGSSETVEGLNMIELGEQGDILTVAHNPVRDTLFAECPELYYLIGEGSVAISNIGTDVMGLGAAAKLGGTKEFLKQCGILAGTEFVEDTGATFLVENLGMSEYEAAIAMMVLGTVTYEGVNVATGNWRRNQSVLDYDGSGGKNRREGYTSFADEMSPEDAARYMKFLENGSSAGLKDAEMLAIGKVDEFLASEKIDYRDIWNIRNSSRIGEGGTSTYGAYSTKIDSKVTVTEKQELPSWLIDTYKDGQYRTVVTNEDITVYRSFGYNAEAGGAFATSNPAVNRVQTKVDSAILPEWKNTLRYEAEIVIPKGTTLNIGRVGEQYTMSGARLAGDADQFLLPQNWDLNWIKSIRTVKP